MTPCFFLGENRFPAAMAFGPGIFLSVCDSGWCGRLNAH
jgi:hypothetical protein